MLSKHRMSLPLDVSCIALSIITGPRLLADITPCIFTVLTVFTGDILVGLVSLTSTGIFRTSLNSTSPSVTLGTLDTFDALDSLLVLEAGPRLGDRLPMFDFVGMETPEPSDSIPRGITMEVAVADNDAEVADNDAAVEREAEEVADDEVEDDVIAAARR